MSPSGGRDWIVRCRLPVEHQNMRRNKFSGLVIAAVGVAALLPAVLLPGCSINVKKDANGQDQQVDIKTLLGGVHVSGQADVADIGLAVYPGARPKEKDSDGSDKSANVNISGFGYGVKVVALEYESDDAPDKVLAFYKSQLKKYGEVLECHTSRANWNVNMGKNGSSELTCEGSGGNDIELKVGKK